MWKSKDTHIIDKEIYRKMYEKYQEPLKITSVILEYKNGLITTEQYIRLMLLLAHEN